MYLIIFEKLCYTFCTIHSLKQIEKNYALKGSYFQLLLSQFTNVCSVYITSLLKILLFTLFFYPRIQYGPAR